MLYIQQREDGKWWVWMWFASDDREPSPKESDHSFATQEEARDYAVGCYRNGVYEYGVIELDPQVKNSEDKPWVLTTERLPLLDKEVFAIWQDDTFGLQRVERSIYTGEHRYIEGQWIDVEGKGLWRLGGWRATHWRDLNFPELPDLVYDDEKS